MVLYSVYVLKLKFYWWLLFLPWQKAQKLAVDVNMQATIVHGDQIDVSKAKEVCHFPLRSVSDNEESKYRTQNPKSFVKQNHVDLVRQRKASRDWKQWSPCGRERIVASENRMAEKGLSLLKTGQCGRERLIALIAH